VYRVTSPDPFAGAGVTALGLAAARAVESGRADRLVEDPYARGLYEAAGTDLGMRLEWPADTAGLTDAEALHLHGSRYIGVRTRFYDDVLAAAATPQAVLLGAGLDTRADRLAPPDLTVYEVDRPDLLAFKNANLPPGRRVVSVGADLGGDWPALLAAAGLRADTPTTWIAEGVMPYLDAPAQERLIGAVADGAPAGSVFAFDQVDGGDAGELSRRSGIDMESLLAGTGGTEALAGHLAGHGWRVESAGADEVAARYGRDLADPFGRSGDEPPWLRTRFVRAERS